MKILLYCVWQCTFGIVQTILGLFLFLIHRKERHYMYHGAIATECKETFNISLGLFIFVGECKIGEKTERLRKTLAHEYGHTIQSLLLGPLYLFVIGIPSWMWCNIPYFRKLRKEKNISYYSFYTEKWADRLGEKIENKKYG